MKGYLYSNFIEGRSANPDSRNRELVLNCLLVALILLAAGELLDLLYGFVLLDLHYLGLRLVIGIAITACLVLTYYLGRRQQRIASGIVISMFLIIGTALAYHWGTMTPTGVLLFGLTIVMAGILLGSRYSMVLTGIIIIILVGLESCRLHGLVRPNLAWKLRASSISDVTAIGVIYATMAAVSWLFNHQMEQALVRSRRSEAALVKQKSQLEVKVVQRSRQLVAEQLDKVQQIYRLAELGRVSSALFHDMANHLTNVSLDIDGLNKQHPEVMRRIRHDIKYIDDVVERVRTQLRGDNGLEPVVVSSQVAEIIKILRFRSGKAKVKIRFIKPAANIVITSDLTRLRQVVINLLSNAIDAYPASTVSTSATIKPRLVTIELNDSPKELIISVSDKGRGINTSLQKRIFEPFFSTKADGIGIGLFIVKQIVENDLNGSIHFNSSAKAGTTFIVSLPKDLK